MSKLVPALSLDEGMPVLSLIEGKSNSSSVNPQRTASTRSISSMMALDGFGRNSSLEKRLPTL
jgi:hypothetical protein